MATYNTHINNSPCFCSCQLFGFRYSFGFSLELRYEIYGRHVLASGNKHVFFFNFAPFFVANGWLASKLAASGNIYHIHIRVNELFIISPFLKMLTSENKPSQSSRFKVATCIRVTFTFIFSSFDAKLKCLHQ